MGLETLAIGAVVGGAAASAYGAHEAKEAEEKSTESAVAASMAEALEAREVTNYKMRLIRRAGAEFQSQTEAEIGKSDLALSGSPLKLMVRNAREIEMTAAATRRAGEVEYARWLRQAGVHEATGSAAKRAANIQMAGSIFGGVTDIYKILS